MLRAELIVIGAGAAGLATAIFTARAAPACRIVCVDSARRIGAKILVSGGSRCNVTNRIVTERDFWGGSTRFVRNVLRAFPEARAIDFFSELGVALHEEEDGKLFPDSNTLPHRAEALMREADRLGISIVTGERVIASEGRARRDCLRCDGHDRERPARSDRSAVVMCTGGRSLPKTGSDGFGYELARRLGHGCVDPIPALAPLLVRRLGTARRSGASGRDDAARRRTRRRDARRAAALDAFRRQRPAGAEHVAPLASRACRRSGVRRHRRRLSGGHASTASTAGCATQEQSRPRSRVTTIVGARGPQCGSRAMGGRRRH